MSFLTRAASYVSRKYTPSQMGCRQVALVVSLIGAAIMAIAMKADWIGGTGGFASDVTYVMLVCGGFALLVSGLMLVAPGRVRQIGEWILLGTAALAVVLASDLVDKLDNGTVGVKLVMIALVAGALKLSDTFAALHAEESPMVRRQELAGLV